MVDVLVVNHPETPVYNAENFGHRPLMFRQKHIFAKADPYNLKLLCEAKTRSMDPPVVQLRQGVKVLLRSFCF